jgi:hypothetical protein
MAIPGYPLLTGDKAKDAELLANYRRLCLENILRGDLAYLPVGFPDDHLPEALRANEEKE